jgi:molybdopterin/thiamine biosynthesis adenylyltransferase
VDFSLYLRQILLAEIGEPGQRAILAGRAEVDGPGLAHEVARRYAHAAGFGQVVEAETPIDARLEPVDVVDPAARAVLAGARTALRAILATIQPTHGDAT